MALNKITWSFEFLIVDLIILLIELKTIQSVAKQLVSVC